MRNERLRARGLPEDVARHHEQHSTEQQVIDTLPRLADLRVDASISVSSIKTEIISWIRERLVPRE